MEANSDVAELPLCFLRQVSFQRFEERAKLERLLTLLCGGEAQVGRLQNFSLVLEPCWVDDSRSTLGVFAL
jgi:hypothetical protein